jgi:Fe-S-cluster containining protein
MAKNYDCLNCPAYCCTYQSIPVTKGDLKRLARRFDITPEQAERRFTKKSAEGQRILRHRKDHIYPTACRFLDPDDRTCTVYEHRPSICRAFPSTKRCGYWDFMMWERANQGDDEFIPVSS